MDIDRPAAPPSGAAARSGGAGPFDPQKLDPVYVLVSPSTRCCIERALAAIRDAAVPPAARGFNYDVVEGKPSGARDGRARADAADDGGAPHGLRARPRA